jgi:site-specific DNA recombinase
MKKAILYVRVNTDEQADKGYSQRDQDERLRRYCENNYIEIRKVIFEDHSAKTFNRPQWTKLLYELKKQKGKHADLILFTKWDRFSRNTSDAYQMISVLAKLDIEPQAIEQPLNMDIPESKIMLAVYLATPEVENDRRAINVKHGMRRASKEGRYMGSAPIGYDNKTREDGSKHITPNPEKSPHIQWMFQTIADGIFAPDQVRKQANEKGFNISRANFYREIRNPVYCGKIRIKEYKDEEEHLVDGLHQPLIDEDLFYKVQDILTGRKRSLRVAAVKVHASMPLKGFLQCAMCDRKLTGSASRSCTGAYYYYHAQTSYGCGCRYKAEMANEMIVKELKKFSPKAGMVELYKLVFADVYKMYRGGTSSERMGIAEEIAKNKQKLSNARDLLVDDKMEADDFKAVKRACEDNIRRLELALSALTAPKSNSMSIDRMVIKALEALSGLFRLYKDGDVYRKREVLGSVFREKLRFDGKKYRTTRLNEGAALIYQINKKLQENKNGKEPIFSALSREVVPKLQESNNFMKDLERAAGVDKDLENPLSYI